MTPLLTVLLATAAATPTLPNGASPKSAYTTYFYTAGEAVVQGYEDGTQVRIVSAQGKKGTVWKGVVNRGDAKLVPTGMGVFAVLADKKASILVGTPQSCTVVGYFAKNQNGSYRSDQFFVQLPSASSTGPERLVIWAYDDTEVEVRVPRKERLLKRAKLKAGSYLALIQEISGLGGSTVEVKATKPVAAQVYFDEGFIVPADNGRGAGKTFFTYVGAITNGSNDLNVITQNAAANVKVTDVDSGQVLFSGRVAGGAAKTLTLKNNYVKVTSDAPVTVTVAALEHFAPGYAEQHFAAGIEGGLIENDFTVVTSGDLWMFSYYDGNEVTVKEASTGKKVSSFSLTAGGVRGITPGNGLYKVHASKGLSVMGGASICGADYSPAGGLFAIDDAVLTVVAQIRDERVREAAARGEELTKDQQNAPVNDKEWSRYRDTFKSAYAKTEAGSGAPTSAPNISLDELNQRAAAH
jgi:hypothetical protein